MPSVSRESAPPGHTPVHHAGAEVVMFSPTDLLGTAIGAVLANLQSGRRDR